VIASDRRALLLAAAIALVSPAARAQSAGENAVVAESLFHEAVKLFDDGHIHEACEKFAESFRLDPANGTLQDLALCHDREGKIASAWAEYTQLAARAAAKKQDERADAARKRAAELEPRVSRVRLVFANEGAIERVAIDGHDIGRAAWASALPVDPGVHALSFAADGFVTSTVGVNISRDGATFSVNVPRLAPASKADGGARAESGAPSRRTIAWILGGAGVAAIGVGSYFGIRAMGDKSDGDAHCNGRLCDATGLALQDDAHTHATIATIAFGAGIAALGGAAFLFVTSERKNGGVAIAPVVAPGVASVRAEVRF
jgi:hypothetical protein